jgi:glycosyltransferase involved in cell wall biosynthesis
MKILIINNYHFRRGGADSIYLNTINLFKDRGHQVAAFSLKHPENIPDENDYLFPEYHSLLSKKFFDRITIFREYFYSYKVGSALTKLVKEFKPDIVHVHLLYGGLTSSALAVFKKFHIPVIYSAHDYKLICPNQSFLQNGSKICESCKGKKYYNASLNKCNKDSLLFSTVIAFESYFRDLFFPIDKYITRIVASCDFGLRKHVQFRPDLSSKITYLFNFAPDLFKVNPEYIRGEYYLFFGRLSSEKGLLTLVKAWESLNKSALLIIAGTGPLSSILNLYIIENNLNNVSLVGYKSGNELINLIKMSSFIITPSEWYENNPMTIIEGYSYGKPAIGSNIGGIPELIKNNYNGFIFDYGNAENLSNCIQTSLNISNEEYMNLAKNARKFSEIHCSPDVHYDSLVDIYKDSILRYKVR